MTSLDQALWPALFPERPAAPPEALAPHLGQLRFTDSPDPHRHFRMTVPAGLRWRPAAEAGNPPGLLASLVKDPAAGLEIAVYVDEVPREVSPADWALHRLEGEGHTLWAGRRAATPIGTMADLLMRRPGPGGPVITRANMAKDGGRIFTLTCSAPEPEYEQWADAFLVSLGSFALSSPERAPLSEPLLSYCYLYPAVTGFSYPASWASAAEVLGPDACDVRLDAVPGEPQRGTLHLSTRAGTRPRRLASDYLGRLEHEGAHLHERAEPEPVPPPEGFEEAFTLVATGTHRDVDIEVRALLATTPKGAVLLGARGPTRLASPFDWMVTGRAFDIARETLYSV